MAKKENVGSREVEPFQVRDPRPVLQEDALYSGDSGRIFCGRHAGASARYSGRDLSGQRVHRITARDRQAWELEIGSAISCEDCASDRRTAARERDESPARPPIFFPVETLAGEPELWRDRDRRAYLVDRSRLTEDLIDRVDERYRAVVCRERLTVLCFASESDAERGVESEIRLWEVRP